MKGIFDPYVLVTAIFSPPSVSRDRDSRRFFWRDFTRPRDQNLFFSIKYFLLTLSILAADFCWVVCYHINRMNCSQMFQQYCCCTLFSWWHHITLGNSSKFLKFKVFPNFWCVFGIHRLKHPKIVDFWPSFW